MILLVSWHFTLTKNELEEYIWQNQAFKSVCLILLPKIDFQSPLSK